MSQTSDGQAVVPAETAAPTASPETKTPPAKAEKPSKQKSKTAKPKSAKPAEPKPAGASTKTKRDLLPPALRRHSRRFRALMPKVDRKKAYPLPEAVKHLKEVAGGTKFVQTVNLVLHLGIDPKQADQLIRGSVSLPKGIGASKKVIAFVPDESSAAAAKAAGAIEAGGDELVKKVEGGWLDFDVAITVPAMMGKVGKLGKVLGPQGKMPSPKNGTVTQDVASAVKEFAAGKVEFRNDDGGNVHVVVGKANFSAEDLVANAHHFIEHIRRMKPQTSKGQFMKKVVLSGSMSPGVQVEIIHAAEHEEEQ